MASFTCTRVKQISSLSAQLDDVCERAKGLRGFAVASAFPFSFVVLLRVASAFAFVTFLLLRWGCDRKLIVSWGPSNGLVVLGLMTSSCPSTPGGT